MLDGITYKRQVIKFVGSSQLRPGSAIPFRIDLSDYLPGSVRKEDSEPLMRWRLKSPLTSGKHALLHDSFQIVQRDDPVHLDSRRGIPPFSRRQ